MVKGLPGEIDMLVGAGFDGQTDLSGGQWHPEGILTKTARIQDPLYERGVYENRSRAGGSVQAFWRLEPCLERLRQARSGDCACRLLLPFHTRFQACDIRFDRLNLLLRWIFLDEPNQGASDDRAVGIACHFGDMRRRG